MEQPTCIITKLFDGFDYFYVNNPQFAFMDKKSTDNNNNNIKYFQSVNENENEISFICFDSFGCLKEIFYYGKNNWKQEWMQCTNLINIHSSFLENIQNCFDNKNEFVNICQILSQKQ